MFDYIRDSVLILASLVGMYVAMSGLNTWKKQLSGNLKHDIAFKLLKSTYVLRDAVEYVRNPIVTIEEEVLAGGDDVVSDLRDTRKNYINQSRVYDKRWEKVTAAINDLNIYVLEAEVTFDIKITVNFALLIDKIGQLRSAIAGNLDSLNPNIKQWQEYVLEHYPIMYFIYDKDKYRAEFNEIIKNIEKDLKPHLLR